MIILSVTAGIIIIPLKVGEKGLKLNNYSLSSWLVILM